MAQAVSATPDGSMWGEGEGVLGLDRLSTSQVGLLESHAAARYPSADAIGNAATVPLGWRADEFCVV